MAFVGVAAAICLYGAGKYYYNLCRDSSARATLLDAMRSNPPGLDDTNADAYIDQSLFPIMDESAQWKFLNEYINFIRCKEYDLIERSAKSIQGTLDDDESDGTMYLVPPLVFHHPPDKRTILGTWTFIIEEEYSQLRRRRDGKLCMSQKQFTEFLERRINTYAGAPRARSQPPLKI